MSSLYGVALCLITIMSLVSCANTARTVAQESEVKRAPDFRTNNKEVNRQYVRSRY
ncbi:MAG: hypothetical protein ACXVLQ_08455 [Bacteriovorax sp.]